MVIRLKKRSAHELIYCFTLALYIFGEIMGASLFDLSLLRTAIKCFCLLALCLDWTLLYLKKVSIAKLILMVLLGLASAIAARATGRNYIALTALFIMCARNIDFKDIVKTSLIVGGATTGFIVLSSIIGIIPNYVWYRNNGVAVWCLGYAYYSNVPYAVAFFFIMYMYLRSSKITWIEIFVLFCGNYLLYKVTGVRLTFGIGLIALALEIYLIKFNFLKLNGKIIKFFSAIAFISAFFAVIEFTHLYILGKPAWIYKLNILLSHRLHENAKALSRYPITLFGQYIEMFGNTALHETLEYFYIDSGFFYSLMGYGVVFTGVFLLIYSYLFWYSAAKNDKPLFIWAFCVLIFTLINNVWVTISVNPALLAFGCLALSGGRRSATKASRLQ